MEEYVFAPKCGLADNCFECDSICASLTIPDVESDDLGYPMITVQQGTAKGAALDLLFALSKADKSAGLLTTNEAHKLIDILCCLPGENIEDAAKSAADMLALVKLYLKENASITDTASDILRATETCL